MKVRNSYHQVILLEGDRICITKEGTMLYLRVLDSLGPDPAFRVDIECRSDEHALSVMEGLRGKT